MSGLDRYQSMRDFAATPEPKGRAGRTAKVRARAPAQGGLYVMQKHAARRLHYDLRLEAGGVLKSWAVTRGPSLVAGEKRLAVETEDHPIEYAAFEGVIPKGSYGAGDVIVWDRGRWTSTGDVAAQIAKGHLEFEIDGEKLKGRWHLVRMKGREGEKRKNWLLIKADDDEARPAGSPDITDIAPHSVISGDGAAEPGKTPAKRSKPRSGFDIPPGIIKTARKSPMIEVAPALPKLVKAPPSGPRWVHELKYDGYRIVSTIEDGAVTFKTRNGLDWSHRFGRRLPEALRALDVTSAVIDGEMTVPDSQSVASFSRLQEELSKSRSDAFVYVVFDLLYANGYDLRHVAQHLRRDMLEAVLAGQTSPSLRLSEQFSAPPSRILTEVCRLGMEGVVSKTRDGAYAEGRTSSWLKSKCSLSEDLLIAGYLPSSTTSKAIGALAVAGRSKAGDLVYAGRVGTGFSEHTARDLWQRLQGLRLGAGDQLFDRDPDPGVTWVRPALVAEVTFTGWTRDHLLRHAVFKRLRDDKQDAKPGGAMRMRPHKASAAKRSGSPPRAALTHPDRIYWPDAGVSKQGLLDYYEQVWPLMREHVVERPLALKRYPEGIAGDGFFQKNPWRGMPKAITVSKGADADEQLLSIADFDGLAALVQSAALEIHVWGSTLADIEKPDRIVFDLDPAEGVAWRAVQDAAEIVRTALKERGFTPEALVTGGKGIHVCARVSPDLAWPQAKDFTKAVATELVRAHPRLFTAELSLRKRTGRIFVDYLRNGRGATAICPYSTRARAGAPVAWPLTWAALARITASNAVTVDSVMARPPASPAWKSGKRPSLKRLGRISASR